VRAASSAAWAARGGTVVKARVRLHNTGTSFGRTSWPEICEKTSSRGHCSGEVQCHDLERRGLLRAGGAGRAHSFSALHLCLGRPVLTPRDAFPLGRLETRHKSMEGAPGRMRSVTSA
jgi:hypothetical protein